MGASSSWRETIRRPHWSQASSIPSRLRSPPSTSRHFRLGQVEPTLKWPAFQAAGLSCRWTTRQEASPRPGSGRADPSSSTPSPVPLRPAPKIRARSPPTRAEQFSSPGRMKSSSNPHSTDTDTRIEAQAFHVQPLPQPDFDGDLHLRHPVAEFERPGLGLGDEREHLDRRRGGQPQSRACLESDRSRRFQRRRPFRHPVAEYEHRPSLDLGDERQHLDWRRPRQPQSWAELGKRSEPAISTTTAIPTSCCKIRRAAKSRSGR